MLHVPCLALRPTSALLIALVDHVARIQVKVLQTTAAISRTCVREPLGERVGVDEFVIPPSLEEFLLLVIHFAKADG